MQALKKWVSGVSLLVAASVAFAVPVTTYTFEYTVVDGPSQVGSTFQRVFQIDDFLKSPTFFDFGGGNGLWKNDIGASSITNPTPFASEVQAVFASMPFPGLDFAQQHLGLYAELGYYLPGGTPTGAYGQFRLSSSVVTVRPTGEGDYFYDRFYFFHTWSGGRALGDWTPQTLADWFGDVGATNWYEGAARSRCVTATQGPCTSEADLYWSGTARFLGAVTVDPSQVPEPTTIALLGVGLLGVAVSRQRKK